MSSDAADSVRYQHWAPQNDYEDEVDPEEECKAKEYFHAAASLWDEKPQAEAMPTSTLCGGKSQVSWPDNPSASGFITQGMTFPQAMNNVLLHVLSEDWNAMHTNAKKASAVPKKKEHKGKKRKRGAKMEDEENSEPKVCSEAQTFNGEDVQAKNKNANKQQKDGAEGEDKKGLSEAQIHDHATWIISRFTNREDVALRKEMLDLLYEKLEGPRKPMWFSLKNSSPRAAVGKKLAITYQEEDGEKTTTFEATVVGVHPFKGLALKFDDKDDDGMGPYYANDNEEWHWM